MATITLTSSTRRRHAAAAGGRFGRAMLMGAALLLGSPTFTAAQAPAQGGGPSEGIKVHGHWEIEVRNPDGTLAMRREFENALVPTGDVLPRLLVGTSVPGGWAISATGACGPSGNEPCFMVPPGSLVRTDSHAFDTLTVTNTGLGGMQLFASFTASGSGSIGTVSTSAFVCGINGVPAPSPQLCTPTVEVAPGSFNIPSIRSVNPNGLVRAFTQATITPIPLTAGQIVQVRVTISFS